MKYYQYKTLTLPNPNRDGDEKERFEKILNNMGDDGFKVISIIPSPVQPDWMVGVFEKENSHTGGTQVLNG